MQSKATTVAQYLAELAPDRREAIEAVREVFLANLSDGYCESMSYGMIGYCVPHSVYPPGYHCDPRQPLPFAGLASQKGHMSLYLMALYGNASERERFEAAWAKAGKKLDAGKACVRFKRIDDLALDVLAATIRRLPAKKYVAEYEAMLASLGRPHPGKKVKPAAKAKAKAQVKATTAAQRKVKPAAKAKATPQAKPAAKATARGRR